MARHALLLEHGCERTHNDYFADALAERGADASRYGWASLQRDGGVRSVEAKVRPYLLPAYLLGNDTRNTCC